MKQRGLNPKYYSLYIRMNVQKKYSALKRGITAAALSLSLVAGFAGTAKAAPSINVSMRTGVVAPATATQGQPVNVAVSVKNKYGESTFSNLMVDVEFADSQNKIISQKVFPGQSFAPGQTINYTVPFTPPGRDLYSIRVGVLSSDWKTTYFWVPLSAYISTTGNQPPALPLSIWWPTDNTKLAAGNVTLQAMMDSAPIDNYNVFWQVDGGPLTSMNVYSQVGYPHKETVVDVGAWKWNGNGPYKINFVAKDAFGNFLTSKMVTVTIQR